LIVFGDRSIAAKNAKNRSTGSTLYAAHNAVAAAAALAGGQVADRLGARWVFAAGAIVHVAAYVLFAVGPHGWPALLVAFALAGIGIGSAETAESTIVSAALPERLRSHGLGVLGLVQAFGDLGATVVAGLLWSLTSPTLAFGYAAAWMAASLAAIALQASRPAKVAWQSRWPPPRTCR
jgi:MFS family permease